MLFICLLFNLCVARDIILSAGIVNLEPGQNWEQYQLYKLYYDMKIITTSSILVYYITEDGNLDVYKSPNDQVTSEEFQFIVGQTIGLKSLPCLYCDSTIGVCANLSSRLENLYLNKDVFINDTITRALKYNWQGYTVDFEPDDDLDTDKLTSFIIEWNDELRKNNLILSIWIGAGTPYNMTLLFNTNISLVTMDTYYCDYTSFVDKVNNLESQNNISDLGFGLYSDYPVNETDFFDIIKWLSDSESNFKTNTLSIWASKIIPQWQSGLYYFLNLD
jgi:hypothetical protein